MFKRTAIAVLALAASARAEQCYAGNHQVHDLIKNLIHEAAKIDVKHPEKVTEMAEAEIRKIIAEGEKIGDDNPTLPWEVKDAVLGVAYVSCKVFRGIKKDNKNWANAPQPAKDNCIGAYNDARTFLSDYVIGKEVKPELNDKTVPTQAYADQCEEDVRDACEIEGFPGWAIFLIVVGGIIVLAVLIGIIFSCCCNGKGGDEYDDDDA